MKKIFAFIFFLSMALCSLNVCASAPEQRAESAVLATLDGMQVVYAKNPDAKLPPAEFTKLMTAYTTYKIYGNDTVITIPENINEHINTLETRMGLKAGEELKSSSLIYGMLMGQANDAAMAVALFYGGVDEFVSRMNEYAAHLDMKDSSFSNVTGSNDSMNYTTASDMLKLYRAYYADKKLYSYISQKSVTIPATNASGEKTYWTKNHLMSRFIYLDYIYDYANAGVSASSSYGGYSVISSASKGTKNLVCIIMNSVYENGVNYSMIDAKELFDYGFDKFSTITVTKQGTLIYEAELKNQKGKDTLLLDSEKTLKALILDNDLKMSENGGADCLEREIIVNEPLVPPIKKGDVVGKVVYKYQGYYAGETNLLSERDVKRGIIRTIWSGIQWFFGLKAVKAVLLILVCVIAIFIALIINAVNESNKKKKRRRK